MTSHANMKRRPSVHITLQRASRLHRLVSFLTTEPRTRPAILSDLRVGLRTFYRELELLKKCGVKVRHRHRLYHLMATAAEAEGRLPFPDPQLSFAEMAELARCDCPAARRLAEMLAVVASHPEAAKARSKKTTRTKPARRATRTDELAALRSLRARQAIVACLGVRERAMSRSR